MVPLANPKIRLSLLTMSGNDAPSDADLDAFEELARRAVAEADPAPTDASVLARLAFEMRDVPTIEGTVLERNAELAGVRGSTAPDIVRHGNTTVTWSGDDSQLHGLVDPPANAELELQTQDGTIAVERASDGSFVLTRPSQPYRFVVRGAEGDWATPWTT